MGGKFFCPLFSSPFPTFWQILPHITAETWIDLGPTEKFSKTPTYDCSSAMGLGFGKKKGQLIPKTRVPHQKRWKKYRFCPIRAVFQRFWWGTLVFRMSCPFLPNPRPIAELQSYRWNFWFSSVGPRSICVNVGFRGTAGPKLGYKIPKKGAKNLPPKNFDTFFWLKIWCRFRFCYQSWPNSMIWLRSGICHMPKS